MRINEIQAKAITEAGLNKPEKQDALHSKLSPRYKVWSAYARRGLVRWQCWCKNWG